MRRLFRHTDERRLRAIRELKKPRKAVIISQHLLTDSLERVCSEMVKRRRNTRRRDTLN